MITKIAVKTENFRRKWTYTNSARDAWSDIILKYKKVQPQGSILLPAYIGWSPIEGSGIFDSVNNSGLNYSFYELNQFLEIDFEIFKKRVLADTSQLVLLVHYFGFPDKKYNEIVSWLKQNNVSFVEDCAHAWLTDLIGGKCGRAGSYSFYSLHKILPVVGGGLLVDNNPDNTDEIITPYYNISFDLYSIYKKRIFNFKYLTHLLKELENEFTFLHEEIQEGICPQTLPVIVNNFNRDLLYHEMNKAGFGMVSLYHTMIKELNEVSCEAVYSLSKKIINFPIHQDISIKDMNEMILCLKKILHV
jgi:dTDP-4-amino-4,6-dideoxygalactose transaminase